MYVQFAIENAINYDKCHSKKGEDRLACLLDKATVNIGTLFSKQVEGRVSTEVNLITSYPKAEAQLHCSAAAVQQNALRHMWCHMSHLLQVAWLIFPRLCCTG